MKSSVPMFSDTNRETVYVGASTYDGGYNFDRDDDTLGTSPEIKHVEETARN